MEAIKEFCPNVKKVVIRAKTYVKSLQYLIDLFEVAKADFPTLSADKVEVMYYAGIRYARTFGIEFVVDSGEVPDGYDAVNNLEYTY